MIEMYDRNYIYSMTLFVFILFICIVTNFSFNLVLNYSNYLFAKVFSYPLRWQIKNIQIILSGLFLGVLVYYFFSDYIVESVRMNVAYNSPADENYSDNNNNPFKLKVYSDYFKREFSFDLRSVGDVSLLYLVSKTTLAAIKAAPVPMKASVAVGTALSMGTVALGLKSYNYGFSTIRTVEYGDKDHEIILSSEGSSKILDLLNEKHGVKSPSSPKNSPFINSPNEEYTLFEVFNNLLMCVEILIVLALIGIIISGFCLYIRSKEIKMFEGSKNSYLNLLIIWAKKIGLAYAIIWGSLSIFNLSWALFFTIKLIEMFKNLN